MFTSRRTCGGRIDVALIDSDTAQARTTAWWSPLQMAAAAKLSPFQRSAVDTWIDKHVFDAAKAHPARAQNVTRAVRRAIPANPDWGGTALQPMYDITQDFDQAKFLFGNLVCERAIARSETWWRFKEDIGTEHGSSTYVLQI